MIGNDKVKKMEIRLVEAKDAKNLLNLVEKNRKRLLAYFPFTTKEILDLKSTKRFINQKLDQAHFREQYYFLVFDKSRLVGNVTAKNIDWTVHKCELSYFVDSESEGSGVISVALDQLISYCFETLKMNKLYLRISPGNTRSLKLAEKKGFTLEGTHKQDFKTGDGNIVDVSYYALFREQGKDQLRASHGQ